MLVVFVSCFVSRDIAVEFAYILSVNVHLFVQVLNLYSYMSTNTSKAGPSKGPSNPPVVLPGTGNNILISPRQRLNPLLECIRDVGKEFSDIVPDFQVGRTTCILFLSLRYHRLHPEYVMQRIEAIGNAYNLRILLLLCDITEHQEPIRELTRKCLINNITVIVAWRSSFISFPHSCWNMLTSVFVMIATKKREPTFPHSSASSTNRQI